MPTQNSSPQISPLEEATVESNVIVVTTPQNMPLDQQASTNASTRSDQTETSPSAASSRVNSRSPPPGTINMSGLRTSLPDIPLNSPSTNIVGTPFAHTASNTPFEYPFPETSGDSKSPLPSHRPGSPHGIFQPHPLPPPLADGHSSGISNPNHPKYRVEMPISPPPVPPSLKKKRWSLNFLGRRRTSNPPTPTGEGPSSFPSSPPATTSGAILSGLGSGRPKLGSRTSSGCRQAEDTDK